MARALGKWTLDLAGSEVPDPALVGGKAWSIAHLNVMGLPTPPAFVITTAACRAYLERGELPDGLRDEIAAGIATLEDATGRTFGRGPAPLLVAVRSGAAVSMPGMMDTVLNLGIDDGTEAALAEESGDSGFARDTHRRFHEMYARIVLKAAIGALDPDGGPEAWRGAIAAAGAGEIPATPAAQLVERLKDAGVSVPMVAVDAPVQALARALEGLGDDGLLCITGSVYLAGWALDQPVLTPNSAAASHNH